jgi:hypothetical protein
MQDKNEQRIQKFQMIASWQQSGLAQKAFCAIHNIPYHIFHYWYGVYRSNQKATDCFLPLNIPPSGNQELITITGVNSIQVQFPFTDQSVRFIKQLLLS